jgi:hypothetical protein
VCSYIIRWFLTVIGAVLDAASVVALVLVAVVLTVLAVISYPTTHIA